MHVVLLKNCSKELIPINVGDASVAVQRADVVATKSGTVGVKHTTRQVSSSITLMPGKNTRVPGVVLKQRPVQRMIDSGVLVVIQQRGSGAPTEATPTTVEASTPLVSSRGSHPVVEEGVVSTGRSRKKGK